MHRSGSEELGVAQFASAMSVPQNGAWSARFNTFPMAASLPLAAPLPIRCVQDMCNPRLRQFSPAQLDKA